MGEWLFSLRRKVSSSWLPCYITVTPPVLEILNMARYFPDRPCTLLYMLSADPLLLLNTCTHFASKWYSTAWSANVSHNSAWHSCAFLHKVLIFSHINTVPPVRLSFLKKAANIVMFGRNVYTLQCKAYESCHMLPNVITPFLTLSHSALKKSCRALWSDPHTHNSEHSIQPTIT